MSKLLAHKTLLDSSGTTAEVNPKMGLELEMDTHLANPESMGTA